MASLNWRRPPAQRKERSRLPTACQSASAVADKLWRYITAPLGEPERGQSLVRSPMVLAKLHRVRVAGDLLAAKLSAGNETV